MLALDTHLQGNQLRFFVRGRSTADIKAQIPVSLPLSPSSYRNETAELSLIVSTQLIVTAAAIYDLTCLLSRNTLFRSIQSTWPSRVLHCSTLGSETGGKQTPLVTGLFAAVPHRS